MVIDEQERGRRGRATSQIVVKIVVSLMFGAVAFLISLALDAGTENEVLLGIGMSVFISGVAFVVQFMLEVASLVDSATRALEARVDSASKVLDLRVDVVTAAVQELQTSYLDHERLTQQLIRDEFTKISAATKLFSLVEASALKNDAMTQLVLNATTIERNTPSLIFDFAQAEIERLSGYLRDLGLGGDVFYDGEDRDWLLGLTTAAASTIDATSLTTVDAGGRGFIDGGLWNSDLGQRYLEAQKKAIERGVVIRRIFIVDRPDLRNDDKGLGDILKDHHEIGVSVRTLDPLAIPPPRRALLVDFIIIDSVLVYQSTNVTRITTESRPIIASTRLITTGTRVQQNGERYKELWASAEPYEPLTRDLVG